MVKEKKWFFGELTRMTKGAEYRVPGIFWKVAALLLGPLILMVPCVAAGTYLGDDTYMGDSEIGYALSLVPMCAIISYTFVWAGAVLSILFRKLFKVTGGFDPILVSYVPYTICLTALFYLYAVPQHLDLIVYINVFAILAICVGILALCHRLVSRLSSGARTEGQSSDIR